ncbi:hypothetical protein ccbrp13_13480 [Ktedonobacteria bacterium brp13]|nr:hypothetical protein ccbrp13_13480 [Ktedonobacteria bacterium brp13]
MNDKPEGARLGWKIVETLYPFSTPWMKLRQDRINIKGKGEILYTYHQNRGSVCIVPLTKKTRIVNFP